VAPAFWWLVAMSVGVYPTIAVLCAVAAIGDRFRLWILVYEVTRGDGGEMPFWRWLRWCLTGIDRD
jgi:hypothetical protein